MSLVNIPLDLAAANELVARWHRHSKVVHSAKFSQGCLVDGVLVGAAICARPAAMALEDDQTIEVARLVTDGTTNACSFLYGVCARIGKAMGYRKIQTYILESEAGTSLKATGWVLEKTGCGGTPQGMRKDRPNGHEITPITYVKKQRWAKVLAVVVLALSLTTPVKVWQYLKAFWPLKWPLKNRVAR